MKQIYGALFHISTTSGDFKQLKGKPFTPFQSLHIFDKTNHVLI